MTGEQCDALVKFVAALPRPTRRPAETAQHAAEIAAGQKLFERTGCAVCHQPKLGDVDAIYSDLLLHDMGQSLSDNGFYGGVPILAGEGAKGQIDPLPVLSMSGQELEEKKPKFGAGTREWRTPPLWGTAGFGSLPARRARRNDQRGHLIPRRRRLGIGPKLHPLIGSRAPTAGTLFAIPGGADTGTRAVRISRPAHSGCRQNGSAHSVVV